MVVVLGDFGICHDFPRLTSPPTKLIPHVPQAKLSSFLPVLVSLGKQTDTIVKMEEMFQKMLHIFRKAAHTPEQISRAEKNVLQYRPPQQKADATVKARTSSESFEDLVKKCSSCFWYFERYERR
jgi:hypothetical protein